MSIKFENVSCGYNSKRVVSNLNLSIENGEAVCILGPNGIGKTTIFKAILQCCDIQEGTISFDGINLKAMSNNELAKCFAYVPQAKNYSYEFTVQDVVLMGRAIHIEKFKMPKEIDYEKVTSVLEKLELIDYKRKKYSELSGGEQQIVLLARAIVQDSKIILLDEPASNLDYKNQKKLIDIIKWLKLKGKGVLMVSHNPEHAIRCCERTLLMFQDGKHEYGYTNEVVNEKNLSKVYGVKINSATNEKRTAFYVE